MSMRGTAAYEYEKNLHKFRGRAEKRGRMVRRAAAGAGIALSLLFGWKGLKAEEIMAPGPGGVSEISSAVSVSSGQGAHQPMRDSPSSEIFESTETEKAKSQPEPERLKQFKQIAIPGMCELSEAEFEQKNPDGEKLYACLFDADEDNVMSAISAVGHDSYRRNAVLENKIVSRIIQILEARDEDGFLHAAAARAVKRKKMHKAIPAMIKSFGAMNNSAKEDAVDALGMFARGNDWNSINMLVNILKDEEGDMRAHAMANLVFVNKNVMDAVKLHLRMEDKETRSVFCRDMLYLYVENEHSLSPEELDAFFGRIGQIRQGEKDKDVLNCLEFFDEEMHFFKIRRRL